MAIWLRLLLLGPVLGVREHAVEQYCSHRSRTGLAEVRSVGARECGTGCRFERYRGVGAGGEAIVALVSSRQK